MDKSPENSEVREAKWCDHVHAKGHWLIGSKHPTIVVFSKPTHILVDQGVVKILCGDCLKKGLQISGYLV